MTRILLATLLALSGISSHANETKPSAVEVCAYDISIKALTVVMKTVGLHRADQIAALYKFDEQVCVEHRGLASQDGLDADGIRVAITNAITRALNETLEQPKDSL